MSLHTTNKPGVSSYVTNYVTAERDRKYSTVVHIFSCFPFYTVYYCTDHVVYDTEYSKVAKVAALL